MSNRTSNKRTSLNPRHADKMFSIVKKTRNKKVTEFHKEKSFNEEKTQIDKKWCELVLSGKSISRRSYHSSIYYNERYFIKNIFLF